MNLYFGILFKMDFKTNFSFNPDFKTSDLRIK